MEKIMLPVNELLCGLAEECAELGQAALKLRRAYDQTNPTPIDPDDAYEKMMQEIADVMVYLDQLPINWTYVGQTKYVKINRWKDRLTAKEAEQ